jgi:hypothetical protein
VPINVTGNNTPAVITNGTISFSLSLSEIMEVDPLGTVVQNFSLQTENITVTCIPFIFYFILLCCGFFDYDSS